MNNAEFLEELASRGDGSLQAWFDAEHVDATCGECDWPKLAATPDEELQAKLEAAEESDRRHMADLAAQTERANRLQSLLEGAEADRDRLHADCERWRSRFGRALDKAHEIQAIADGFGLGLVDMDGEVVS